jgi:triacylglycerol lipase
MSALVELPPAVYEQGAKDAFDAFKLESPSDFDLTNARALMWFSQLAYETGQRDTVEEVRKIWKFETITPVAKLIVSGRSNLDTRCIIGQRGESTFIAFGGTDPLVWQNLWTDGAFVRNAATDIHQGFQAAFDAVVGTIDDAIDARRTHLFIAGHSMGGALAALAATRALQKGTEPTAVYAFGMPRLGGATFATAYNNGSLGAKTYRLVHGLDLVPRVPFAKLQFFHVGRVLQCSSGKKFDRAAPLSAIGSNEPTATTGLAAGVAAIAQDFFGGKFLQPEGPGPFGPLFRFLPPPIRDHLQDQYWTALAP